MILRYPSSSSRSGYTTTTSTTRGILFSSIIAILLILSILSGIATSNPSSNNNNNHINIDNNNNNNDDIEKPTTKPPPFIPTHEFQKVLPGQAVPPGLHLQFDVSKGVYYAKLLDKNELKKDDGAVQISAEKKEVVLVSKDEEGNEEEKVKEQSHRVKFHHPKDTTNDSDSITTNPDSKLPLEHKSSLFELIDKLYNIALTPTMSLPANLSQKVHRMLDILEEEVHHIDVGSAFAESENGFPALLHLLNRTSDLDFKAKSARVLGNVLQNNPISQSIFMARNESTYFDALWALVWNESGGESLVSTNASVKNHVLFAFSALMRGNKGAVDRFQRTMAQSGFPALRALLNAEMKNENVGYVGKMMTLWTFLVEEHGADLGKVGQEEVNGWLDSLKGIRESPVFQSVWWKVDDGCRILKDGHGIECIHKYESVVVSSDDEGDPKVNEEEGERVEL